MVKRAAVSRGGAHVLALSASDSCEFSVLRRLDPAHLSKNVARGRELFRLDVNCVRDLPAPLLKTCRRTRGRVGYCRRLRAP